jgi:hypothetical protein
VLRAEARLPEVQLLHGIPPRPPYSPALGHVEVLVIRPGPASITPGRARGGVVFGLYDGDTLLAEDEVPPPGRGPSDAMVSMALSCRRPTVLVVYDGDSGERLDPGELSGGYLWTGVPL